MSLGNPKMQDNSAANPPNPSPLPITVLGMGHVGIPTALGLAELGWNVTGVDQDAAKIALLQEGRLPFYEPGLEELLAKHLQCGGFTPSPDVPGAIRSATVLFICVGTPQRGNGETDLSQVEAVAQDVARHLNGYKLIVEKSTVPAITAQWIKRTIQRYAKPKECTGPSETAALDNGPPANACLAFDVASNPEFLREGRALEDFLHPDRIVCGVESDRAWEILAALYRPLRCPLLRTDLTTAEMIKHAANTFLATKISFINMIADLCEVVGADIETVAEGIGLDRRIGPDFLRAGIGFGGYCLPKDLRAFVHLAETRGVDFSLLREVEGINQRREEVFLQKVRRALGVLQGKTLGILGLAFKPDTDDIREAPSIPIIQALLAEGVSVQLYDPRAMPNMQTVFPAEAGKVNYSASPYEAARGAHALLLLTEWEEFRELDLVRLRSRMERPLFLDGRNLWDPEQARSAGIEYISVGR